MTDLLTLVRAGTATLDAASTLLNAADSIDPNSLPPGLPVYMGYGNGRWPDYEAIAQAHPGATVIDFSVYLANLGDAGDFEPGDMTPEQAPIYVRWRLAAGVWRPIVYSSISEMPAVIAALTAAGIDRSQYRVLTAHYGRGKHICAPGACPEATANGVVADGTQWENTPGYDLSVLRADFLGAVAAPSSPPPGVGTVVGIAGTGDDRGYWLAEATGRVRGFGDATVADPITGALNKPVVGIAARAQGGYWLVAADGGVFPGDGAPFFGSAGAEHLNRPVVGMAETHDMAGYWLAAGDGGVFAFGDAMFKGSTAALALNKPVVGIAGAKDMAGYWLAAGDGGVFNFGDAVFHGSAGSLKLAAPIVGIAARPQGDGYWLAGADGGVFCFGSAGYHGSTGGLRLAAPIAGMAVTPSGNGYWLAGQDGGVFAFGDAPFVGAGH